MKKIVLYFMLLITLLSLSSCSFSPKKDAETQTKVKLGIIETTGYKNKSYIHFFDENLNFLYKEENKYAALSEPWDYPIFKDGKLYAIPRGRFEIRKETCILQYDLTSDTYTELDTGLRSMNRLAVSNDFAFGVNTFNADSTIVRRETNSPSSDFLSKVFDDIYVSEIIVLNEELYAIFNDDSHKIFLAKLSMESLDVMEKYDITQYGSPCSLAEIENKIYISNQYSDEITGELSSLMTIFDKDTKSFSQIDLQENSPNNLIFMQNLLFISHFDRVQGQGNKISVLDLKTNAYVTHSLNHPIKQILTDGNFLYILGDKDIYKYVYKNEELIEVNQGKMDLNKSRTFFFVTSFFLCE